MPVLPTNSNPDPARRRLALASLGLPWLGLSIAPVAGCSRAEPAPNFDYTLLDGSRHSSQGLRGQVVLLNFWATSCAPCVAELPQLSALHQRLQPSGLQTLAVAMPWDPPARVSQFAQARQLPFGVVIDLSGSIAKAFGNVQQTPTRVLLNRRGEIAGRWTGEAHFEQLQRLLQRLLAEAPGP